MIQGVLLGEDSGLSAERKQQFRDTGTFHILAVSGFNVALVVAMSALMLSPIVVRSNPWLRRFSLMRLVAFFVEANAAIGHATIKLVRGQRIEFWDPSKR